MIYRVCKENEMKTIILGVACVLSVLNLDVAGAMNNQLDPRVVEALVVLKNAGLPMTLTNEMPQHIKRIKYGAFSRDEDKRLKQLVGEYGLEKWEIIAERMIKRTPRQCRERWNNCLSDAVKNPWTKEEDKLVLENFEKLGAKWKKIKKLFPGRSQISVKNRWRELSRKPSDKLQAQQDSLSVPVQAEAINVIIQQPDANQNLNQCEGKEKQESNSTNHDSAGDSFFGRDKDFEQEFGAETEDFEQTQICWY